MIDFYSDDLTLEDVLTVAHLNNVSPKIKITESNCMYAHRDRYFALCSTTKGVFITQINRTYLPTLNTWEYDSDWFMLDPLGLPPNSIQQISEIYKHELIRQVRKYFIFAESGLVPTSTPFSEFGGTLNFLNDVGNLLHERHTRKVLERHQNDLLCQQLGY